MFTIGTVDGLGKGNCTVLGNTIVGFRGFSGEFSGTLKNFDVVSFSGSTVEMTMTNSYDSSQWSFNVIDRKADAGLFVSDASSFNLAGDNRTINLQISTLTDFNYDLMDVTDEELHDVSVKLYDAENQLLGGFTFGEDFLVDSGTLSLTDESGVLNVKYSKTVIA